jgi:tetratricopeptide (TPR) repeat protein
MSAESRPRELPLAGERVAFVGKLASLSRAEAKRLVEEAGGQTCRRSDSRASLIVIGQGSCPISRTGRLPRPLSRLGVERTGKLSARVIREEDWLDLLGLSERSESIRTRYALGEIAERTKIPAGRIRRWVRAGLLAPVETVRGVDRFEFPQIAAVRRLDELVRAGVEPRRLKRTLLRLRRWLPEAERSLVRLDLLDRRMTLRDDRGDLMNIDGQRLFDFADEGEPSSPRLSIVAFGDRDSNPDDTQRSDDQLRSDIEREFERACRLELQGKHEAAERAYQEWLAKYGPDPDVCFNLANVLRELGRLDGAIERYRQAIELDPEHAAAWLNLGIALADAGRCEESVAAAKRAVALDPDNVSALYSLADALDETECCAEAGECWRAYLRLDDASDFAEHARRRLKELGSSS